MMANIQLIEINSLLNYIWKNYIFTKMEIVCVCKKKKKKKKVYLLVCVYIYIYI